MDFTGHLHEVITDQTTGGYGQQAGALETRYLYNYNVNVNNGSTDWHTSSVQQIWRTTNWPWMPNSPGTTLSANAYTYDGNCQRLTNQITDSTGANRTELYGYDDRNHLVNVNYGDGQTQNYSFDPMGNRLSKTDSGGGINGTENYSYNNANMLLSRGSNSYANDANGNTLTGGGRTDTWDSENRMVSCAFNGITSNFTYAADGIRHRSVVAGTTTDFVADASMFVRELHGGNSYATYLVGGRGPEYRRDDTTGTVSWYMFDGLGSVLGEVNPSGTVSVFRKYDVYGGVRSGATGISAHKFVGSLGHPSDDNTGLIYMRARYMDPVEGRFVSEDRSMQGSNWFTYCAGNPTSMVDPDGCKPRMTHNQADIASIWMDIGIVLTMGAITYAIVIMLTGGVAGAAGAVVAVFVMVQAAAGAFAMAALGMNLSYHTGAILVALACAANVLMALAASITNSAAAFLTAAGAGVAALITTALIEEGVLLSIGLDTSVD